MMIQILQTSYFKYRTPILFLNKIQKLNLLESYCLFAFCLLLFAFLPFAFCLPTQIISLIKPDSYI